MSRKTGGYTLTKCERCASGEIIENKRFEMNLSISQVARKARLSDLTIRNVEMNGVIVTKVCTLLSICKVLELDPMELIKADLGNYYERLQR